MEKPKLKHIDALALMKEVLELQDEASGEESVECHAAAERLRDEAHDKETMLLISDFDPHELERELKKRRLF